MSRLDDAERAIQSLLSMGGESCQTCATRTGTCSECGRKVGYTPGELQHARNDFAALMDEYAERLSLALADELDVSSVTRP